MFKSRIEQFNIFVVVDSHRVKQVTCELGLVGYDDCLTRSRSRVRFSELVVTTHIYIMRH